MDNATTKPITGADADALLFGRSPVTQTQTQEATATNRKTTHKTHISYNKSFQYKLQKFKTWIMHPGSRHPELMPTHCCLGRSPINFSTMLDFRYRALTSHLPQWSLKWVSCKNPAMSHQRRLPNLCWLLTFKVANSGTLTNCCRSCWLSLRHSLHEGFARTSWPQRESTPELPAEADADSVTCPISLMSFSTRFSTNVFLFSLPFFCETAMFKCLHTSLTEGLPSWELPSCMVSISAFNHASRASGRCRRSSARTWLIYLRIIDDPAEAAEAEEAMASKENRIHTKNNTWISPKRCSVSLTMLQIIISLMSAVAHTGSRHGQPNPTQLMISRV